MSFTAYGCGFDFTSSPVTYMLQLIYYRTDQCPGTVNWRLLNASRNATIQPIMPAESQAVTRTLTFTTFYLILCFLLFVTCLMGLGESFAIQIKTNFNLIGNLSKLDFDELTSRSARFSGFTSRLSL